jgi:GR25 family glycosyltransferase involved in LPS biosynthesis
MIINMSTATRRWANATREVEHTLPNVRMHRMEAVDWRTLPQNTSKLPVTLFTQYLLSFPEHQTAVRVSHRQLDTLSSVAILMSHMKCWRWLLDHPKEPYLCVLEDDACFDSGFRAAWQTMVLPLLAVSKQWDVLVLGYFAVSGAESFQMVPGTNPAVTTKTVSQFFGAHAYIVTRHGAEILLKHCVPMDVHADALFLILSELQRLRVNLLPQSVVSQCMDSVNREGSWHTHTVVTAAPSTAIRVILFFKMGPRPRSIPKRHGI